MEFESNSTLFDVDEESYNNGSIPWFDQSSNLTTCQDFIMKADFMNSSNLTFDDLTSDPTDFYAEVYSNSILNWSMVSFYVLGLVTVCPALGFIVWFEVSGEAGPYRTILNRLATHLICLMVAAFVVSFISVVRAISGPMPTILCKLAHAIKQYLVCNASLITSSICTIRYLIVCRWKHLPIMDDKFLQVFILLASHLFSFLVVIAKLMLDDFPIMHENICAGTWYEVPDGFEARFIPAPAVILICCGFIDLITSLRIYFVRKHVTIVQPYNHQAANATNLGSLSIAWLFRISLFALAITYVTINKLHPVDFIENVQLKYLVFVNTALLPVIIGTTYYLGFFTSKPNLWAAAKRELGLS